MPRGSPGWALRQPTRTRRNRRELVAPACQDLAAFPGSSRRIPVTRKDIAEMTGVTYFTVSRVLSGWQKRGIVRLGRTRIVLVEERRLVQISG
ncbi:Crp/Fnr family transcriptional regulator [Methylobacterium oxalidis]|uniref:Crp/Fnr family transcriptional regulator n=1 Tax=Methylobacterium oxalidis TaxID=944322 RepID=UPI003314E673